MRSLACILILLSAACASPEMTDEQRAEVAAEIMDATNAFVAGLATLDGDGFVAPFTDAGDLVYVDGGRIYPDRNALKNAFAGFASRQERIGGSWDPSHVTVLGPDGAAFTGVFHADVVDTAGVAQWTNGKIWTFVYQRRGGEWKIVQAHESNGRAPSGN
jgi:uncharacterized protein (TIGR02246 family)